MLGGTENCPQFFPFLSAIFVTRFLVTNLEINGWGNKAKEKNGRGKNGR